MPRLWRVHGNVGALVGTKPTSARTDGPAANALRRHALFLQDVLLRLVERAMWGRTATARSPETRVTTSHATLAPPSAELDADASCHRWPRRRPTRPCSEIGAFLAHRVRVGGGPIRKPLPAQLVDE